MRISDGDTKDERSKSAVVCLPGLRTRTAPAAVSDSPQTAPLVKLSTYFSLLNRRQWLKVLVLGTVAQTAFGKARPQTRRRRKKPAVPPGPARRTVAASVPRPTVAPIAAPAELTAASTPPPQTLATLLTPSTNSSAIIPIRISDFSALGEDGGSVSIYFSNLRYPIVINRADAETYYAVDPTCTHQACQVGNYNRDAFYMECDCHGSLFSIDGRVAGGPALFDLTSYPLRYDGADLLEIELYGVPLRIDSVQVQSSTALSTRLRIDFPGIRGGKYQIRYFPDLTAPPQPALFSLTPAGPADQASFTVPDYSEFDPLSGDGPKVVWVDAPGSTGFFAVEMVLSPIIPL